MYRLPTANVLLERLLRECDVAPVRNRRGFLQILFAGATTAGLAKAATATTDNCGSGAYDSCNNDAAGGVCGTNTCVLNTCAEVNMCQTTNECLVANECNLNYCNTTNTCITSDMCNTTDPCSSQNTCSSENVCSNDRCDSVDSC
jgi:hypothetical protein